MRVVRALEPFGRPRRGFSSAASASAGSGAAGASDGADADAAEAGGADSVGADSDAWSTAVSSEAAVGALEPADRREAVVVWGVLIGVACSLS